MRTFVHSKLSLFSIVCVFFSVGCLDRPTSVARPNRAVVFTEKVKSKRVDKIDLLLMIDNSVSMADKQKALAKAVPDLVQQIVNPPCQDSSGKVSPQQPATANELCPSGTSRIFEPLSDIHIGVITSSLGSAGGHWCQTNGSDQINNSTQNDRGHLITRRPAANADPKDYSPKRYEQVPMGQAPGFLDWDPLGKKGLDGYQDASKLQAAVSDLVLGADQIGCAFESSLESWYQFLVEPEPRAPSLFGSELPPVDNEVLYQRAAFLRPDSLVLVVMLSDENDCSLVDPNISPELWEAYGKKDPLFTHAEMVSQTLPLKRCAENPSDPVCKICQENPSAPECQQVLEDSDSISYRCWQQKERFGIETLYPVERYIQGLGAQQVLNRKGETVPNPLFQDLPFEMAHALEEQRKQGTISEEDYTKKIVPFASALKRGRMEARDANQIIVTGIVGVPWQDLAKNPKDLAEGYLSVAKRPRTVSLDWDLILNGQDPLMSLTPEQRTKADSQHPVTKESLNPTAWNSINGHEWNAASARDFQYACIFPLEEDRECDPSDTACDCYLSGDTAAKLRNPLCEGYDPNDPTKAGNGTFGHVQARAKAYPGTRFLELLHGINPDSSIVASICPANLTNANRADYGYRPAMSTIVERLRDSLGRRCLERKVPENLDGTAQCLVIDGRFADPTTSPPDPQELTECKACDASKGYRALDPDVQRLLPDSIRTRYGCLCEVVPLKGEELNLCQIASTPRISGPNGEIHGWCYVDPEAMDDPERKQAAEALVAKCPSSQKQLLQVVGVDESNVTRFMTCLGNDRLSLP
jgi:hypothetical protein